MTEHEEQAGPSSDPLDLSAQQLTVKGGSREDRVSFGPPQLAAMRCLADGEAWTATRIAVTIDPVKDSEAATNAGRILITAALGQLEARGFIERSGPDGWRITDAGRDAYNHRVEQ
ncbi:hypothetical protein AB0C34_17230 [Nocardia sp. NPDC049220]|uniref:hypothetical protein n=1 Tax=Nocardia sp. NPDC049220 TaxID=3155273 RepID=UPI0033FF5148